MRKTQQPDCIDRKRGHIVCILHHTLCHPKIFEQPNNLLSWQGQVIRLLPQHIQPLLSPPPSTVTHLSHLIKQFLNRGKGSPKLDKVSYELKEF